MKHEGLLQVNDKWSGFFGDPKPLNMVRWRIKGDITTFVKDVKVR